MCWIYYSIFYCLMVLTCLLHLGKELGIEFITPKHKAFLTQINSVQIRQTSLEILKDKN